METFPCRSTQTHPPKSPLPYKRGAAKHLHSKSSPPCIQPGLIALLSLSVQLLAPTSACATGGEALESWAQFQAPSTTQTWN